MKEQKPRIAILILGYNDQYNLPDVISSVLNQNYGGHREIIYIDNASTDNSLSIVKENYPQIRIISNTNNLGYAKAYKEALDKIFCENFEAAILLNSDVIVEKKWLEELTKSAFSDSKIALAQPKIFLWDGKENNLANTFGNEINYLGFGFCGHFKKTDTNEFNKDREITYASGACLLIKKYPYIKIGGLDDNFFAYLEDQDLGWRAKMLGYKIILSANSKMWHKYKFEKTSRNRWKFYMLERNRFYFLIKNYSQKLILLILPALFIMEIGIIANSIFNGYLFDKIRGYRDIWKNMNHLLLVRKKIQENRTVQDKILFKTLNPTVNFEEIDSPLLRLANFFLKRYYKIIKLIL